MFNVIFIDPTPWTLTRDSGEIPQDAVEGAIQVQFVSWSSNVSQSAPALYTNLASRAAESHSALICPEVPLEKVQFDGAAKSPLTTWFVESLRSSRSLDPTLTLVLCETFARNRFGD